VKTEEEPAERRWGKAKGQNMSSRWGKERLETGGRDGGDNDESKEEVWVPPGLSSG